jgi:hypothetical protein
MTVPHHGESISSQSARDWLDDGKGGGSGDGGVDGIASRSEHAKPRLRGQGLGSGHDIAGKHGRTS